MKIALLAASGNIGQRILREALQRGHQVVAVVRDPSKISPAESLTVAQADFQNVTSVATAIAGSDAVVSAYGSHTDPESLLRVTKAILAAMRETGVSRYIAVGGAGGLRVASGERVIDDPNFPAAWKPAAEIQIQAYEALVADASDLDWTFFAPAGLIQPGERTGKFRTESDNLVVDEKGESHISTEDYAVALVDELENPRYLRSRMTVGY